MVGYHRCHEYNKLYSFKCTIQFVILGCIYIQSTEIRADHTLIQLDLQRNNRYEDYRALEQILKELNPMNE